MVRITDTAAVKLKEIIAKRGSAREIMLRISFGGVG